MQKEKKREIQEIQKTEKNITFFKSPRSYPNDNILAKVLFV